MSEHGADRTGAGEGPEVEPIDDTTMAKVTEPILRALESTASATSGMLQSAQGLSGLRRSPRLPESRDVASSVVEVGLRAIERAALVPRQMMRSVFGEGIESRTPPPPATGGPRARAQPFEGQPARRPGVSAFAASPGTVTGAHGPRATAEPGRVLEHVLAVENRSAQPRLALRFESTDLVDMQTRRAIPSAAVSFRPSTLTLPAHSTGQLTVVVKVPIGQPPGRYVGLVSASAAPSIRTVVEIHVQ